eukprot:1968079-Pleurochrysis_carterae.AAC.1
MRKAAGFLSQPPDHCPESDSYSSGSRARQTMHSWSLTVAITRAIGGWRSKGDQHGWRSKGDQHVWILITRESSMHVEEVKKVNVMDVEAPPFRSEAGVDPAGTTPSRAASADAFAARGDLSKAIRYASSPAVRRNQEFTCSGSASAKLAHFSSGHRMNLRP